ncbi:hypothetical protein [Fibrobacter succinogenes]|uniref:hypothetical protein n=1 Tax=Fibrobacter succinogenes TaxID=833 RepID=UPI0026EB0B1A|nr:hypothetical protein [Fibrobacter succinogenes]
MFDKYADEAIEAEIWLKGREQGRDNRNVEKALDMLADDEPVEKIVKYSRLPESKILELKQSLVMETRK